MPANSPTDEPTATVAGGAYDVLHVEDDASDARLVLELLRESTQATFRVRRAVDLRQAENELAHRNFDVVLLDLQLPGSSGLDTLQRLRRVAQALPIVVVTGLDPANDAIQTLQAANQLYLAKRDLSAERLSFMTLQAIRSQGREQYFMRITEELRRAKDDLDRLACIDPLTGLFNRRGLERVLVGEQSRSERGQSRLTALFVDCDDFKSINDTHGHPVGDAVLSEIAARLKRCLRPTDQLARVGGDEFLALVHEESSGDSMHVAERLRTRVRRAPIAHPQGELSVTISVGVAAVPDDALSIEELLLACERALQLSKASGKDRVSSLDDGERASRATEIRPQRASIERASRRRGRAPAAMRDTNDPQLLHQRIAKLERIVERQQRQLSHRETAESASPARRPASSVQAPAHGRRDAGV
jgi:diguanylate cyclase (GGDEF)-like protein